MEKFMKVFDKIQNFRLAISFIFVGLLFLIISIVVIAKPNDKVYIETTATISRIEEVSVPGEAAEDTQYDVYVNYRVNGEKYTDVAYGAYNTGMKVGDEVKIEYNQDAPDDIQAPGSEKIVYIILVVGILAIIFGIFRLLISIKNLAR